MESPNFKHICFLNMQRLTNFPYIEADFDALTNYEMLCKIVEYLNEVIANNNTQNESITELYTAFNTLKDFVDNYFENLDVQEEINTKLDQMVVTGQFDDIIKDYIDPMYQEYVDEINSNIDSQNERISNIEDQVSSVVSGALFVSSTSEMSDTTRIYVNTTDGYWYYYDGTNWVQGGIYQSTGIANNSINVFKLDNQLQNNFLLTFSDFLESGADFQGYCDVNNGKVRLNTTTNEYFYNVYDLETNSTYVFSGYNYYSSTGLIIADSDDNVIYSSQIDNPGTLNLVNYLFQTNQNGLKAYVSSHIRPTSERYQVIRYINGTLRKLNQVSLASLKKNFDFDSIYSVEDAYCFLSTSSGTLNWVYMVGYRNVDWYLYPIEKGKKYTFNGYSYSSVSGLIVTNLNYIATYHDTDTSSSVTELQYSFTASENGYAICHDVMGRGYTFTVETPDTSEIEEEITESVLASLNLPSVNKVGFSNWYAIGDSITEVNFRALHNYLYYIKQDIPDLNITNLGISGTGYMNGNNTFIDRIDEISSYNLNNSIITVMGSVNDMSYVSEQLGQLGDTTTDTLYGSMYVFFTTLFTKFNGVRIGCISPINWKNSNTSTNLTKYKQALKETCELFNVPYLDMTENTNLRPNDSTFLTAYYTADGTGNTGQVDTGGVHPNSAGHRLFYGRIKEFICSL